MNPLTASSTAGTYERLASLLAQCPETIEVLPGDSSAWLQGSELEPAFAPFLFVENNLGVPQRVLWKVYVYALNIFKASRSTFTVSTLQGGSPDASTVQVLIASTSILILANPSHQTAVNTRKQLITMQLIDPLAELCLMASLLSSHHCAKHAELWYHRRWLLSRAWDTQSRKPPICLDPSKRLLFPSQEALEQEFKLVARACESYPRNYFAWTHRTICTRSLLLDHLSGTDTLDFIAILRREIEETKRWIARHVSDYSAVHYILTISRDVLRCGDVRLRELVSEQGLLVHAISLVQDYPSHETLWMYVRGGLPIFNSGAEQTLSQYFVEHFVQPLAGGKECSTREGYDITKASQYARLYLDFSRQIQSPNC